MSIVKFSFEGEETVIQCSKDDYLKDIINKFILKSNINEDEVFFLYGGNNINMDLSFFEQANKIDKERNQMNIIVFAKEEPIKEGFTKSKYIILSKCKQNCLINIKDYKVKLYDCKNKHETDEISLNEFDSKQKINENEIICKNCGKTKYHAYKNCFYTCLECKKNLCPLCNANHDKSHEVIDYNDIKYICLEHGDYYISYCQECKINLCMNCENKHDIKHKNINYKNILPEDNIKEELKAFRDKLDKLNNCINEIKNVLNKISDNMEIYYTIIHDIVNNFDKKKKNYEILKNISSVKDFINIPDIEDILGANDDYKKKFDILINVYNKMKKININNDLENVIKDEIIQKNEDVKEGTEENQMENKDISNTPNQNKKNSTSIIECKILKKTELNDKNIIIKVDEPEIVTQILGKKTFLYKVQTEPFNWVVYRKFSDFEDLRKLITKFFPEFYVPFLRETNAEKNTQKQIQYLNLFINKLVQNESFKTSKVLLGFLSYKDKKYYESMVKDYMKRQRQFSEVEEYETIDGKAKIFDLEESEKYLVNISKFFKLNSEILDRNNDTLNTCIKHLLKNDEYFKSIKKNFEISQTLCNNVMMKQAITKTYEELVLIFKTYQSINLKMKEIIKYHFKDFFKVILLEGKSFKELITRREKIYEKYIAEKSKPNNERNANVLYNQLGYADSTLMKELKTILKEYCIRYVENIKSYNVKYYDLINEMLETYTNTQEFVNGNNLPENK